MEQQNAEEEVQRLHHQLLYDCGFPRYENYMDQLNQQTEQENGQDNDLMCKGNGHHNWSLQKDTCECGELKSSTPWKDTPWGAASEER